MLIILSVVILKLFSYSSLERIIIFGNIEYFRKVDFEDVCIDDDKKSVDIIFRTEQVDDVDHKIIKRIAEKCSEIVYKDTRYKKYKVCISIIHASKEPLFCVIFSAKNDIEEINCEINEYGDIVPVHTIGEDYPNIRKLYLNDIYSFHIPNAEEWNKSNNPVYEQYCNIDNYKKFTDLEEIRFCIKPKEEVITFLKDKFPNCKLKYDMIIE